MDDEAVPPAALEGLEAMPDVRRHDRPDDSVNAEEPRPEPDPRSQAPRRRGLVGRVLGRAQPVIRENDRPDQIDDEDTAEAEATLQRKIDREIRRISGRHLRGVDVVVRGRVIYIRADVDRVWNRRGVRRDIEALPILAGYDARVRVE